MITKTATGELNQARYHAMLGKFLADLRQQILRQHEPAPYGRAVQAATLVLSWSNHPTAVKAGRLLAGNKLRPATNHPLTWICESLSNPGTFYIVSPGRCSCRAGQNAYLCCHRMAAMILAEAEREAS
jgi:SWIM zinc finger